jgi:hypothetical protein
MNSTIHSQKGFYGEKWIYLTPENVQKRHDESYGFKREGKCFDQLADKLLYRDFCFIHLLERL